MYLNLKLTFIISLFAYSISHADSELTVSNGVINNGVIAKEIIDSTVIIGKPPKVSSEDKIQFLKKIDQHTPISAIDAVFGKPAVERVFLPDRIFRLWRDEKHGFSLFILYNSTNQKIFMGGIKSKSVETPIPYFRMGRHDADEVFSFDNFYFDVLQSHDCIDNVFGADARYVYWTVESCYFGRPGGYNDWSFGFVGANDCSASHNILDDNVMYLAIQDGCFENFSPTFSMVHFINDESISLHNLLEVLYWDGAPGITHPYSSQEK